MRCHNRLKVAGSWGIEGGWRCGIRWVHTEEVVEKIENDRPELSLKKKLGPVIANETGQ
jgi:hypothetical protein